MKKIILFLFIIARLIAAQSYFPDSLGTKWFFKNIPLDSLNNEIDSLVTFQIDSFAVIDTFKGRTTNFVLSKSGIDSFVVLQHFVDTGYVNASSSIGATYIKLPEIDELQELLDSLGIDSSFINTGTLLTLKSFEKWYDVFKFNQSTGSEYQIFRYDTTITIDTLIVPLRFEVLGKRLSDQSLTTLVGTFNCKKFILSYRVSYVLQIGPIPVPFPLITVRDTTYIAPNKWIVQSTIPSSYLDLSLLNLPSFSVPGRKKISIPEFEAPIILNVNDRKEEYSFQLLQNYPNPFNPGTLISWKMLNEGFVTIKIHNVLGREIATLINNDWRESGIHNIQFSPDLSELNSQFSSGIYFYTLSINDGLNKNLLTRKMIFMK